MHMREAREGSGGYTTVIFLVMKSPDIGRLIGRSQLSQVRGNGSSSVRTEDGFDESGN